MKEEEYTDQDIRNSVSSLPLNRREFLKGMGLLGGGIIFYISSWESPALAQRPADFNAFLSIGADGRVKCFTGKIEMGQGIITSLAQMLADELDVSYESVHMVMGDTDLCPWDRGTWGSMTTRFFGPVLREAAAEARGVMIALASESLKIPVEKLKVKDGVVFDNTQPDNQTTYAQLTQGKIIETHLKKKPSLKDASEFTVTGKSFLSRDTLEKVTGKAKYAGDIHLPGMVYAKILRPPAHGSKIRDVDTSEARAMEGVLVVQDGDMIAVLHKYPDEAEKASAKIKAQFDMPKTKLDDKNIFDHLLKVAPGGSIESQDGSLEKGRMQASGIIEKTYVNSYVAHAPIETHTAVATVEKGKATVWASTQTPFGVRKSVANALGIPSKNVRVINPFVGGGFGGKSFSVQAVHAARLSKLTGKPVQVAWNRAEEFFYDTFRPAAVVRIASGINRSGKIVLWDYEVYFAGSDGAAQFYDVPHHREVSRGHWRDGTAYHPFSTGPWRAPGTNTNTFARESQIDIMASRARIDPLQFRMSHLSNKKMRRVLKAAAEKFGWRPARTPSGRGFGVACGIRSGTYVATMAEVEVDESTGGVQVKRVVCAQDMGLSINPHGATLQMEGCVTMGLGYALTEEVRFKNGEIFDLNFDTYEIPRFSWVPKIDTVIVMDKESPPQGGGEPPIVCMGAVIANAIFDAIGVRLLQLPMTPNRILEAIETK